MRFKIEKRSDNGCGELEFADFQEWYSQAAKRSYKSTAILQDCRFADVNESRFQASKGSNIGSDVQHLGRFADAEEYCIPVENHSKMRSVIPPVFDLLMLMNNLYRLRKLQMWAVMS